MKKNSKQIEMTFSEWNSQGYRVHRGQKCIRFENNEPVFNSSQVYDPNQLTDAEESYALRAMEWEDKPC